MSKDLREQIKACTWSFSLPEENLDLLEALITKQVNEARIDELLSCRLTADGDSRTEKWIDIRLAELQTGDKE